MRPLVMGTMTSWCTSIDDTIVGIAGDHGTTATALRPRSHDSPWASSTSSTR
jgi:hypothetical protein